MHYWFSLLIFFLPAIAEDLLKRTSDWNSARASGAQTPMSQSDRQKAALRQQFAKAFHDIQVLGQGLLREHESRQLTPKRLAKDTRSINKSAKTLRSLMALGELAEEIKLDKEVDTPEEFDKSIRRLSKLIWDFAHNPTHQNNKVFNADLAARAQTDLLTIINLSKVIENKASGYLILPTSAQK
jgi:hypothetical protein